MFCLHTEDKYNLRPGQNSHFPINGNVLCHKHPLFYNQIFANKKINLFDDSLSYRNLKN